MSIYTGNCYFFGPAVLVDKPNLHVISCTCEIYFYIHVVYITVIHDTCDIYIYTCDLHILYTYINLCGWLHVIYTYMYIYVIALQQLR